jgi:three-Cys-motif partner protein
MLPQPDKFLLPEDDGLPTRLSNDYAKHKLKAVEDYLQMASTAMRSKPWCARFFLDLQAGPGKNTINNAIFLGSPLIALTTQYPFTHYRFNELDLNNSFALEQRVSKSPHSSKVIVYQQDVNDVVNVICDEIAKIDRQKSTKWPSFNVAFLDPEGLELYWSTVERLAQIRRMDLIINFSTSGIIRNLDKEEVINKFFGNSDWQPLVSTGDPIQRRRKLIDLYLSPLAKYGYKTDINLNVGTHDVSFRNSKNAEVYSLIFASKHELGGKFWRTASAKPDQPKLF